MANTLRIKRRASGSPGAPTSLANAELAFNEVDNTLYYGKGTGGAGGTATTVDAIGGSGSFLSLSGTQTVTGNKTFSGTVDLGSSASATTQTLTDNSTKVATTAFVKGQSYLTTNQSISLSGDATGSGTTSIAVTLKNTGTAGTYTKVTTDAQGRVSSGTTLSSTDIPTLTASKISDFDTQVRTSRLDQMASPTASVSFNSQKITGLATPTSDTDAATKAYVDATRSGLDVKDSVRAATTANITLSGTQTIDGVTLVADDRVLVKNQSTGSENGIYVVASGSWTRASDFDNTPGTEVTPGAFTFVEEGTINADSGWVLTTNGTITIGSTSLTFAQFSGAGSIVAGSGLTKTGNTLDIGAGTGIVVNADDIALTGQALALHNLATNGFFVRTGSATIAARSITTSGSGISVSNGDGVSGDPSLSLTTALSVISSLTPAADSYAYYTGASTASLGTITSFGRSLVDDADASTARTTLGLGTISTQASSNVSISGGSISNLTTFDGITVDGGTF